MSLRNKRATFLIHQDISRLYSGATTVTQSSKGPSSSLIRVKTNQNQNYLNTPRQESECTIKLAEPFTQPPPALDEVSTTKKITANILGISNVNKYNYCNCAKKVAIKGKLTFCGNCKMSQKSSTCHVQWSFRLYIQNCAKPKLKLHLHVYGEQVMNKLFAMYGIHETSSEDEILESLLDIEVWHPV